MKKLTRLGTIFLTLGVSLALLSMVRGSSTNTSTRYFYSLAPKKWTAWSSFWVPRSLKLEINAQTEVNLNLYDPSGIELLNIENTKQHSYTINLNKRGTYNLSIYNPSNSISSARLDLTFYDLEKDLTTTSVILGALGIAIIATHRFFPRFKRNNERNQQHSSILF